MTDSEVEKVCRGEQVDKNDQRLVVEKCMTCHLQT